MTVIRPLLPFLQQRLVAVKEGTQQQTSAAGISQQLKRKEGKKYLPKLIGREMGGRLLAGWLAGGCAEAELRLFLESHSLMMLRCEGDFLLRVYRVSVSSWRCIRY